MTDEQKFRLLEWMKSVTAHLELLAPPAAEIVKDDLHRFEQSLKPDDARTASRRG